MSRRPNFIGSATGGIEFITRPICEFIFLFKVEKLFLQVNKTLHRILHECILLRGQKLSITLSIFDHRCEVLYVPELIECLTYWFHVLIFQLSKGKYCSNALLLIYLFF